MKTVDLAKDIVYLCRKNNIEYSNTKVQKLLYIVIGYALANGVIDENYLSEVPKALPFGPIFTDVMENYRAIENDATNEKYTPKNQWQGLMEAVVKEWGGYSAKVLSDWSHEPSSPWHYITQSCKHSFGTRIPYWAVKHYFEELSKIQPIYVTE